MIGVSTTEMAAKQKYFAYVVSSWSQGIYILNPKHMSAEQRQRAKGKC
ncbi:hypothetical protein [Weissella minor]|nr:hypothetical protein [Weissella minor]